MTNSIKAKLILLFLIVLSHKIKAQIAEGNYYIYSINSFLALTGSKNTDGSSALTLEKNNDKNNNNQIWIIKKNATGYTIKSKANNVCIDVYGSSTKENSEVNLYEETGNINQIFIFEKRGNSYVLKGLESDKYITTNDAKRKPGSNVVQRKNTNTDDQLWGFTPADVAIFAYNEGSLTVMQSELNNKNKNYKINPIPARNAEATRMGRFAPADYLPSGIYVEEGVTVTIEASGLANMSQDFLILVGEPNAYWGNKKENNPYEYVLKNGNNSFTTNRSGLLYFNYTNHPFQYYKNNTVLLKITNGGIASPLFIYNKTDRKSVV